MKLVYTSVVVLVSSVLIFLSFAHSYSPSSTPSAENSMPGKRTIIVELFTSEGCSSCPPADALLKTLSEQQPVPGTEIIALEEHVDYWDHLGWKDPFSSAEFSERQNEYAKAFENSGVYTPQMIVDGHTEFVGSRAGEARETIQKAASQPKATIQLIPTERSISGTAAYDIKITDLSNLSQGRDVELWVAMTEKGLHTDVKAGENSGEHLQHAAVVRTIHKTNSFSSPNSYQTHIALKINPSWQRENLSFVAFAVDKDSRKIIGAASAKL
ncbi:MAG TPA: DUF1223 domain-containing protein [Candidatus Acidoferrum sp.]|jgi:hypothetical protein